MLHGLVVLIKLRVELNEVFNVNYRVFEVIDGSPMSLGAFERRPVRAVEKDCLGWRELLELFQRQILPLQVNQLLEQFDFVLL